VSWAGLTFVLTDAAGADRRHPPGLLSIPQAPAEPVKGLRLAIVPAMVVASDAA
jgi:hypothetical protein